MALSRRNVLIGLGGLVGGGGLLAGTGAFTTVSAERTVSVNTAGDASAFLTITGDDEYVADDSSSDALTIDLGGSDGSTGFNENAITTLASVVTITNNAADGENATVGVSEAEPSSSPSASGSATISLDEGDVTFYVNESEESAVNSGSTPSLSNGSSAYLDVVIDTTVAPQDGDSNPSLTIVANEGTTS